MVGPNLIYARLVCHPPRVPIHYGTFKRSTSEPRTMFRRARILKTSGKVTDNTSASAFSELPESGVGCAAAVRAAFESGMLSGMDRRTFALLGIAAAGGAGAQEKEPRRAAPAKRTYRASEVSSKVKQI